MLFRHARCIFKQKKNISLRVFLSLYTFLFFARDTRNNSTTATAAAGAAVEQKTKIKTIKNTNFILFLFFSKGEFFFFSVRV